MVRLLSAHARPGFLRRRYGFKRTLGDPNWLAHFENRALEAYKAVNTALAS